MVSIIAIIEICKCLYNLSKNIRPLEYSPDVILHSKCLLRFSQREAKNNNTFVTQSGVSVRSVYYHKFVIA